MADAKPFWWGLPMGSIVPRADGRHWCYDGDELVTFDRVTYGRYEGLTKASEGLDSDGPYLRLHELSPMVLKSYCELIVVVDREPASAKSRGVKP
jgi:hypothetical protein